MENGRHPRGHWSLAAVAVLGHFEQPKEDDCRGQHSCVSITKSRVEILSVHPTEWKETWALDQGRFLV